MHTYTYIHTHTNTHTNTKLLEVYKTSVIKNIHFFSPLFTNVLNYYQVNSATVQSLIGTVVGLVLGIIRKALTFGCNTYLKSSI